ncbi:MAG: hypothetical protein ABIP79_17505 [Chitinophagaceae bacterium]
MKKNILLSALIVLVIISCTIFISDGPLYLVVSLMGFTIMAAIYRNRTRGMKMTRWSKANPRKAQLLITGLQIVLLPLGIIVGNNLKELGYEFSNTTSLVFGTIILLGFFYVPFLPQRKTIVLPSHLNRQRFAFMSIALSSFVMMILFGNSLQDKYPNSSITKAVKAIDQAIFPDNSILNTDSYDIVSTPVRNEHYNHTITGETSAYAVFASFTVSDNETILPPSDYKKDYNASLKADKKAKKFEKKKARLIKLIKKHRLAFAGMSAGLAILLIILLSFPLCAGICLIVSGGGAGSILGGIALIAASIFGIIKVAKATRKNKEGKP